MVKIPVYESEEFSQAILDSLPAQIVVLDKTGTIINVNEAWERTAEENKASAQVRAGVGLNYRELCRTAIGPDAEYARQCLEGFESLLTGSIASFDMEYPFDTPAEARWFLLRAVPLNIGDGGLVVSHIDITERKQAEAELQKRRGHLEELVAERAADLVDVNQRLQRELVERKRAESQRDATLESLRLSQKKKQAILDNMLQSFVLFDCDGRILAANALARRNAEFVYGRPLREGGSIYDLVHKHERQAFGRDFSTALSGVPVRRESPISIPNGDVYWYDFSYAPVFDDDGQVWAIAFTALDITERVQAEEALRESEARLRSILDHTPSIIYIKDLQGRYALINRKCEDVLNLKNDEITGKTTHEILPQELADQFVANDRKVIEAAAPLEVEEMIPQDDGLHTVLSLQFPLRDASGEPYAICGISTDITERVRAEDALRRAHDELERRVAERTAELAKANARLLAEIAERQHAEVALRKAHQQLEATLNALPNLLFEVDRHGRFYDYRAPRPELLYVSPQKFLGKTVNEVLPEDAASTIREAIHEAVETGQHLGAAFSLETPGGLGWFDLSIAAKGDPKAADGRLIVLVRDITERKRAGDKLRQRLEVEGTLATISARFMQATDFNHAVSATLEDVSRLVGAGRAYLFRFRASDNQMYKTNEWCAPGVAPLILNPEGIPATAYRWLMEKLRSDEVILIEDVSRLTPDAQAEREALEQQQVKSLVVFPLYADTELAGFFGCDNLSRPGANFEENLRVLKVVGGMLGGALQREAVLEMLEQRVTDRTRELAVFFDMTMLASQSRDMQDILEPTIARILEISRCQAACIHLLAEDQTALHLVAQRGIPDASLRQVQIVLPQSEFSDWITRPSDPILALDLTAVHHVPMQLRVEGFRSYLGAQLRVRGQPQGILSCFWESMQHFSLDEISLVVAIAEQLGVTVENNRLRQQIEEMAVDEERQRLARELHDAVTQSLYSLTLFARSGREALEDEDVERLETSLSQLEDTALLALKEMRLLLYQLLPLALEQEGLVRALNLRFDSVERRLGVEVDYQVEGSFDLPKSFEREIYRIAVEALNNALKHARASLISVHIWSEDNHVRLKISDNGQGFDTNEVYGGMGLKNMMERAESLGGWLKILSTPGEGTHVLLSVDNGQ